MYHTLFNNHTFFKGIFFFFSGIVYRHSIKLLRRSKKKEDTFVLIAASSTRETKTCYKHKPPCDKVLLSVRFYFFLIK